MTETHGPAQQPAHDPGPSHNLMDPALMSDPFGGYGRIREEGPVVPAAFFGLAERIWLVTRYDDVRTVLSDQRFVVDPANVPGGGQPDVRRQALLARGVPAEYLPYLLDSLLDFDGEDHLRLRRLVSRAFTARRVADLRPRVEEITAGLLDALPDVAEDGVVDLIEHFAYPLPITVICELVGIPEEDRPRWRGWGRVLASMEADSGDLGAAIAEMIAHIRALIDERRARPADDLLTGLTRVHDEDGDRLRDAEMITMVLTLVLAGHETTAHLIGNGTAALLADPGQLTLLREDPGLMPRAVHELMRWCGPVQGTRVRYAREDVEIGGVTVRRGESVMAILVSANHDPRAYAEPDRLDLTRSTDGRKETHVGFGHGLHYCLGAALARQEGEVAFTALFRRFPDLALAVPPEKLERQLMPGSWRLKALPVRL